MTDDIEKGPTPLVPVEGLPESPQQLTADVANLKEVVSTLQQQVGQLQAQAGAVQQQLNEMSGQMSSLMSHTHTYNLGGRDSNGIVNLQSIAEYIQGAAGFGGYADYLVPVWNPQDGNPPAPGVTETTSQPLTH